MLSFRAGVVCPGIFQFSGFILRDGASRLLGMTPSRRALLTMVRSAAAPRVSNHEAAIYLSDRHANFGCATSPARPARSVLGQSSSRPSKPDTIMMTALMVKPVM